MKRLVSICLRRNLSDISHSWDIVFEWGNEISELLNLPISYESKLENIKKRVLAKLNLTKVYNRLFQSNNVDLEFVTDVYLKKHSQARNNKIFVIIDFWYSELDISDVIEYYKNVPLVLITNKEAYDLLKKHDCPIPIEHWPLSLPDRYIWKRNENFEKKYEFCLLGRNNPFFVRLLDKYCETHPDFSYIYSKGTSVGRQYFTNRGEFVAKDTGREFYIDLMQKTKITCYTTPGLDESKKETGKYNQVTPRVMEMLANGCQVIGHYPHSADTIWYELDKVVPNVNTYEEFEACLNCMRKTEADINKIKEFLSNHYTSTRVKSLTKILTKHNIHIG